MGIRSRQDRLPRGNVSALPSQEAGKWPVRTIAMKLPVSWIGLSTVSGDKLILSLPAPLPKTDEAQAHIDEFYRRKAELLPYYEGKYVAFRDGKVLDSDLDRLPLARRFYGKYGYVSVCMAKVTAEGRIVRAPSPRRKR